MSEVLDAYFEQYAASVEAMNSLSLTTLRGETSPTAAECSVYAHRLAGLETSLLSKRDQLNLLWLRYRACVVAALQEEAITCMELAATATRTSAKKFAFAKLPQVGHADDDRHQARVMADAAEDEFWPLALNIRAQLAVKGLRKAAKTNN